MFALATGYAMMPCQWGALNYWSIPGRHWQWQQNDLCKSSKDAELIANEMNAVQENNTGEIS